jgi:hypothetical protein
MNATHPNSVERLAQLNPYDFQGPAETPEPLRNRNAVCRDLRKEGQPGASYGCVDWYQYMSARTPEAGAAS